VNLGFFEDNKIQVGKAAISPREFTVAYLQQSTQLRGASPPGASLGGHVMVHGVKGGAPAGIRYRFSAWGGPVTAIPTALAAQKLARGEVRPGVWGPESAFNAANMIYDLCDRGLRFHEQWNDESEHDIVVRG
jgi:saccharopine dehydrogenase-like NADP-dependent oxidoreductase